MVAELISKRGSFTCRVCNSEKLHSVLDLGLQPLPAEYGRTAEEELDVFPLHLKICENCGLGQLGEYVLPERIFHNTYPYLSSASSTWISHAKKYANQMLDYLQLDSSSLVLELASNDGYLLSQFKKLGIPVLGVEPASNVASIAKGLGINTITDFFGVDLAKKILEKNGHPSLIAANNVFAHIPDMHDFTEGMSILSDEDTVITIENPSFKNLLQQNLFDTIYHEHYSYLTAHSVRAIGKFYDLNLFHVDILKTHGGSNRYWLSKSKKEDNTVYETLQDEINNGLFDKKIWEKFANSSKSSIEKLRNWLIEMKIAGNKVVGYGAAHKGNTFLNAVGKESKILSYVVDASKEKQGKFLPGSQVPVFAPEKLIDSKPDDVLILPWNISSELAKCIRELVPNVRIWVAHPEMRQL